jgi:hypothetical protein
LRLNTEELHALLDQGWAVRAPQNGAPEWLFQVLATVLELKDAGHGWEAVDERQTLVAQVKRLKNRYGVKFLIATGYTLEDPDGNEEPIATWLRHNASFSVSFSSPEYFYAEDNLFRKVGFEQEVAQVRRFLQVHDPLDAAISEKGGPYEADDSHFSANSIFGVVENTLALADQHLWCCDLGDEWADYIGVVELTRLRGHLRMLEGVQDGKAKTIFSGAAGAVGAAGSSRSNT